MSDIFFGMEDSLSNSGKKETLKPKRTPVVRSTTENLNFGNISKELNFNNSEEGYFKVRPKALVASTHNPRPDWDIDDAWLVSHVAVDFKDIFESNMNAKCLVKITELETEDGIKEKVVFPSFDELLGNPDESTRAQYDFLVELAKSIHQQGQIQPIEVESNLDSQTLTVVEGHLRRLACILGRVPYIKAIRNEGLKHLNKESKIERQIAENSVRKNVSIWGVYNLAAGILDSNHKISVRDLGQKLSISKNFAAALKKLYLDSSSQSAKILPLMKENKLSSKSIIHVLSIKNIKDQDEWLNMKFALEASDESVIPVEKITKVRGKDGRKKSVATIKIKNKDNCIKAGNRLLTIIPQLSELSDISNVESVEDMITIFDALEKYLLTDKHD